MDAVRQPLPLLLTLAVGAWLAAAAWLYRGCLMDDAYIGLRYAANLAAGQGLAFNPPERVEGVTNLGWVLLLAPLSLAVPATAAARLLGLLCLGLTLALLRAAARPLAARLAAGFPPFGWLPLLAVLLAAVDSESLLFSFLGMETAALAAVLAGMFLVAVRGRGLGWLPVLGALAFLLHPEAALAFPLGAIVAWALGALPGRRVLRDLLLAAALLAGLTLARWAYFGDLLPNTFRSKPGSVATVLDNLRGLVDGTSVNVGFPLAGPVGLPLAVAGVLALRRASPLAAAAAAGTVGAGLLFALYARPDWTELGRYFAPYMPVASLLLAAGALEVERRLLERKPGAWRAGAPTLALAALVALVGVAATVARAREPWRLAYPGYILTSRTLVAPALWLREHLPAGATVATRRIGAVGYWSGLPVFDYTFGLTEREVARLIGARGNTFDDPNAPELARLWRERAPGYLLEDGEVLFRIAAAAGGTPRGFRVHGLTYRMVRRFPIARGVEWVLAERVPTPRGVEARRPGN